MPEPVPHSTRRIVFAWLLILACLAVVVARNAVNDGQRAMARLGVTADAAQGSGLPTGVELQMRYLVGLHALLPRTDLATLVEKMETEIGGHGTAAQRLALVPVLGALQGEEAARARLVKLDAEALGFPGSSRRTLTALHALYPVLAVSATGAAPASATASAPASASVSSTGAVGASVVEDPGAVVVRDLGWAGQLAAGHGDPGGAVETRAIAAAEHLTLGMFGFFALGVGALVCALWFLGALAQGTLQPAYVTAVGPLAAPTDRSHPVWAEVFALYLAAFLGTGEVLRGRAWGSDDASMAATWCFIALAPLLYGVLELAGLDLTGIRAALGWHRGSGSALTEMAAGFCGWLAGAPVVVVMALAAGALAKRAGLDLHPDHPLVGEALAGHGWGHWLILVSVASIFAPVVEETMFRGALFQHLRGWMPWWPAALIGGVVFAALHPQGLAAIPPLCAMAVVFTAIRTWRGSMIANMTAHACNNGMVLGILWCVQT